MFGNDPSEIADLFAESLRGKFHGTFAHIIFAVLDFSEDQSIITPFQQALG